VLIHRKHWQLDARLSSRTWRMAVATAAMGGALVAGLAVLRPALAHPDLVGALALLGLCAAGGVVYGAAGAALGVVKLSEIRFMLRRQPGVRPDDPAAPQ
jgi:putative peptidoglycan lipid II flippase